MSQVLPIAPDQAAALNAQLRLDNASRSLRLRDFARAIHWAEEARDMAEEIEDREWRRAFVTNIRTVERKAHTEMLHAT